MILCASYWHSIAWGSNTRSSAQLNNIAAMSSVIIFQLKYMIWYGCAPDVGFFRSSMHQSPVIFCHFCRPVDIQYKCRRIDGALTINMQRSLFCEHERRYGSSNSGKSCSYVDGMLISNTKQIVMYAVCPSAQQCYEDNYLLFST